MLASDVWLADSVAFLEPAQWMIEEGIMKSVLAISLFAALMPVLSQGQDKWPYDLPDVPEACEIDSQRPGGSADDVDRLDEVTEQLALYVDRLENQSPEPSGACKTICGSTFQSICSIGSGCVDGIMSIQGLGELDSVPICTVVNVLVQGKLKANCGCQ